MKEVLEANTSNGVFTMMEEKDESKSLAINNNTVLLVSLLQLLLTVSGIISEKLSHLWDFIEI